MRIRVVFHSLSLKVSRALGVSLSLTGDQLWVRQMITASFAVTQPSHISMNRCQRCPLLFAGQRYWSVSESGIVFIWDYFFTDSFFQFQCLSSLSLATMVLGKVKSFTVSFDCLNDTNVPVFSSGDCVSGRVIIEVTGEIRVKSLKIHAKGLAKVRWTESRNAGSNTAYTQNYTEEVEYLNHKDILIGHERGKKVWIFNTSFWETDALRAGCSPMKDRTPWFDTSNTVEL